MQVAPMARRLEFMFALLARTGAVRGDGLGAGMRHRAGALERCLAVHRRRVSSPVSVPEGGKHPFLPNVGVERVGVLPPPVISPFLTYSLHDLHRLQEIPSGCQ